MISVQSNRGNVLAEDMILFTCNFIFTVFFLQWCSWSLFFWRFCDSKQKSPIIIMYKVNILGRNKKAAPSQNSKFQPPPKPEYQILILTPGTWTPTSDDPPKPERHDSDPPNPERQISRPEITKLSNLDHFRTRFAYFPTVINIQRDLWLNKKWQYPPYKIFFSFVEEKTCILALQIAILQVHLKWKMLKRVWPSQKYDSFLRDSFGSIGNKVNFMIKFNWFKCFWENSFSNLMLCGIFTFYVSYLSVELEGVLFFSVSTDVSVLYLLGVDSVFEEGCPEWKYIRKYKRNYGNKRKYIRTNMEI